MNKARRKQVDELQSSLQELLTTAESLRDEEQEEFDNLLEGLQQSERGQAIESNASALDEVVDGIQAAYDDCAGIE